MKKTLAALVVCYICASCGNNANDAKTSMDSASSNAGMTDFAYTKENPNEWEMGDPKDIQMVLRSLKAYENGNIAETMKDFADTVHLQFDNLDATVSRDSLQKMFEQSRGQNKSMEIKMSDWETVVSKDKKEKYVSLWYKEIWEDNNGKKDSISVMDDLKIVNGKIAEIDQKTRHYPAKQ